MTLLDVNGFNKDVLMFILDNLNLYIQVCHESSVNHRVHETGHWDVKTYL